MRSFLGLANQLSGFVPDFAHMTVNLHALTPKKNAFLWLPEHQEDFEKVKKLLTSDMVVTHFDPNLPVTVLTDPSRLHSLGYAMGYFIDRKFKVVACGLPCSKDMQQLSFNVWQFILLLTTVLFTCSLYLLVSMS